MTDANLMDADCIHGVTWYECKVCAELDRAYLLAEQISEQSKDNDDCSNQEFAW